MDRQVRVGDRVRARAGRQVQIGRVVGESHSGTCWVLETVKGKRSWNKGHCVRISASEASGKAREITGGDQSL